MKKTNKPQKPNTPKMTVQEIVNDRIIGMLKQGTIPWHKPWSGSRNGAVSHVTGRPYSLLNQLLLPPGEYITFNQCKDEGGQVKKGAKSHIVVFWKQTEVKTAKDGEEKTEVIPLLRYYRVFHIDDCENISAKYPTGSEEPFDADEEADRIASEYFMRTSCKLVQNKRDSASYSPAFDRVMMPQIDQFDSMPHYYATLFHEIGHSTGHTSRLNRFETPVAYGDKPYSREELVAELTSAMILYRLGLENGATIKNSAAYIQSWLKALQDDTRMLIWAAGRADKAVRLIMDEEPVMEAGGDGQPDVTPDARGSGEAESPEEVSAVSQPAYMIPSVQMAAYALAEESRKLFAGTERESLAGAKILNGRQYIANRFMVAVYDVPIQNLPPAGKGKPNIDLEDIINRARKGTEIQLPPLSDLKEQYKKAKGRKKTYQQLTCLAGGLYVNTALLIQAMELAGVTSGNALQTSRTSPIYIQNIGCEVVVFPVRTLGKPSQDVWTPKIA